MTCTFFGHRDTPQKTKLLLPPLLRNLIEKHNVDMFYVGNHGAFDLMVRNSLKQIKLDYPHIDYAVVLAYMPGKKESFEYRDFSDTIYPDGLENTPPKYAIIKRNHWMIDQADYVITYVKHNMGGAATYKQLAEKKGKIIINLAE